MSRCNKTTQGRNQLPQGVGITVVYGGEDVNYTFFVIAKNVGFNVFYNSTLLPVVGIFTMARFGKLTEGQPWNPANLGSRYDNGQSQRNCKGTCI